MVYEGENKILREESQKHLEEKEAQKKIVEMKDLELENVITDLRNIEKDHKELTVWRTQTSCLT